MLHLQLSWNCRNASLSSFLSRWLVIRNQTFQNAFRKLDKYWHEHALVFSVLPGEPMSAALSRAKRCLSEPARTGLCCHCLSSAASTVFTGRSIQAVPANDLCRMGVDFVLCFSNLFSWLVCASIKSFAFMVLVFAVQLHSTSTRIQCRGVCAEETTPPSGQCCRSPR